MPSLKRLAAAQLTRFRELATPGRSLNAFESIELETLEQTFGQYFTTFLPIASGCRTRIRT